jgi:murein DD-endopeptidase MepM/ murein hydrolase activator NlpD
MVCPRRNPRRVGTPLAPALLFTLTAACESDRVAPRAITGVTVSIAPAETILAIGSSATLIAEVRDADGQALTGRTITWGTSAPEIAAVTDAGLVRALAPGRSTISAFSEPGLGLALVVVQEDLRLPLPGGRHWLLLAETGTSAGVCAEGEGGLRHTGDRECSHAGVSRYSLDFAAVTEQDGALAGSEVLAAADGRVIDVCILPQAINCGPEGAFVLMEHRGGLRTLYGHLDGASIMVRRKTALARGQRVGRTAASSTEPAPWVHFELRFENRGAQAASALEALLVDGRKLRDYRVAPGQQRFYPSSNAAAGRLPDE